MTLVTAALHQFSWLAGPGSLPVAQGPLKHLADTLQVMTLPAWLLAKGLRMRMEWLGTALFASALGWGAWAWIVVLALRLRDRIAAPSSASAKTPDLSRRRFTGNAMIACGAAGIGGASIAGAVINPLALRIAKYRVPIKGLPKSLHGLTLVQITDLHLGPRVTEGMVIESVRLAASLNADIYALTGDYVETGNRHSARIAELLVPLIPAAKIGVVGILGNHDFYGDPTIATLELSRVGVRMLRNARIFIGADRRLSIDPPAADALCIAGVDDLVEADANVDAALNGVDPAIPRLLLSHNPDVAELRVSAHHRVDLMLCGHTHGGQVLLPIVGAMFVPSFFGDKYRHGLIAGPHCPVIVSAGVGLTVMPIRVGVPPEIVHVTLESAQA
jgi:predicted MPP superfamily phosphohydrolase